MTGRSQPASCVPMLGVQVRSHDLATSTPRNIVNISCFEHTTLFGPSTTCTSCPDCSEGYSEDEQR